MRKEILRSTRLIARIALIASVLLLSRPAPADQNSSLGSNIKIHTGLSQDFIFKGANAAIDYECGRWSLEYSHGWDLHVDQWDQALTSEEKTEKLKIKLPFSTGFAVGYRFTPKLKLAVEFKVHKFEIEAPTGQSLDYLTYSVGPGLSYDIFLVKGLFLRPIVRWWPTVATTLSDEKKTFTRADGSQFKHEAHNWDVFGNLILGYSF